jgi:hypothetical protein
VKEEFLELLRRDPAFREEVRRQLLSEDLLALPGRFDHLTALLEEALSLLRETVSIAHALAEAQRRTEERMEALFQAQQRTEEQIVALSQAQRRTEERMEVLFQAQQRTEEQIAALSQAQRRTEEELRWLVSWQRGEDGRRRGERYERDTLRRASALFNGGQGGTPEQPWVQQWLTEGLGPLLEGLLGVEEDPFLADLLWWKGEQVAVVEASVQVDREDVERAAQRAEILRRAGMHALPVVIGEEWTTPEAREQALARQVEWKVGSDLSPGLLAFRRAPAA